MFSALRTLVFGLGLLAYFNGERVEKEAIVMTVKKDYRTRMVEMGIQCPDVVIAQIIIETGYLTSKIYRENNNLFGMKESSRKWDIGSQYEHALYPSKAHSLLDYREWQQERSKGRIFTTNEEYIYFLGHLFKRKDGTWARYAEDRKYEDKIRFLLKQKN